VGLRCSAYSVSSRWYAGGIEISMVGDRDTVIGVSLAFKARVQQWGSQRAIGISVSWIFKWALA